MSEILIGLLEGMLIVFIMGIVFGWFIQYTNSKRIVHLENDMEDVYRHIDKEVNELNIIINNNADLMYKETENIRSMIDSRLDKLEHKMETKLEKK